MKLISLVILFVRSLVNLTNVLVNPTNVFVNPTNVFVNPTNVLVNPTNVLVNITNILVNPTNVLVNLTNVLANLTKVSSNPVGWGIYTPNFLPGGWSIGSSPKKCFHALKTNKVKQIISEKLSKKGKFGLFKYLISVCFFVRVGVIFMIDVGFNITLIYISHGFIHSFTNIQTDVYKRRLLAIPSTHNRLGWFPLNQ